MNPLYNVPGLGGYLAQRSVNEAQPMQQLQQASAVMGLQKVLQEQEMAKQAVSRQEAFRRELAALGPNATQDQLAQVAARHTSDPAALMRIQQQSLDRQATTAATLEAARGRIEQNARYNDMMHQYRMAQAKTDAERAAETARHNKATEELRAQMAQLAQQQRSPAHTFISTPEGIVVGDIRSGELRRGTIDGRPVMRAGDDPGLQGRIAGAREGARLGTVREFNMEGIGAIIGRAEQVLKGRDPDTGAKRPLPTGSGVGSLYDKAAAFVGMSPEGAEEAQDLKAIAGALTAKMPRMEGPQSDRDVLLYRQMAAEVGEDSLPVGQRLRALETVKMLWRKYERLNPEAFAGGPAAPREAPPQAPQGGEGWTPEKEQRYQELLRKRGAQ